MAWITVRLFFSSFNGFNAYEYFLDRHPEYPERTPSSIEEEAEGVSKGACSIAFITPNLLSSLTYIIKAL